MRVASQEAKGNDAIRICYSELCSVWEGAEKEERRQTSVDLVGLADAETLPSALLFSTKQMRGA